MLGECVLSKLPENCPVCGEKMKKGYIAWLDGNIRWSEERAKWTLLGEEKITRRPFTFRGVYDAEAYRCQTVR